MNKRMGFVGAVFVAMCFMPLSSVAGGKYGYEAKAPAGFYKAAKRYGHERRAFVGKQLVLNAKGRATTYLCEIPATDLGTTQALCFDVPMFDMKTGAYVGILTDALADVMPVDGGGLVVTATSTFKFTEWRKQPSFTTRVLGNVQPLIDGSETMTHITGFMPNPGENNILSGTKRFSHATGSVRESGMVNLAGFHGQPGDEVVIDFVWVVTFN